MNDLPVPLTTAEIDLKGFPGFVLDVERLLASELVALGTAEEVSAALMLWCRAWQQNPPGSLPNDERILAAFSKAKNWKKVREMALRGFILCSDGRLYHRFVCQQVLDAWDKRKAYRDKRDKEAERLREWREKKQAGNASHVPGDPGFNGSGNAFGNDDETRFKDGTKLVRREGEGKGKEKGREVNPSVPDGTGADAPPAAKSAAELTKQELWTAGKSLLSEAGMPATQCGSFVGKLVKDYGDAVVIEAVRTAVVERPADPATYLVGVCKQKAGKKSGMTLADQQAASTAEAERLLFGNEPETIDG